MERLGQNSDHDDTFSFDLSQVLTSVMGSFVRKLIKIDNLLARGEAAALIGLVAAMVILVFLQVIFRYLLAYPLHWSEEISRYAFIWISMIGAALSLQTKSHFGLDLFFKMLPSGGRKFVGILIHLLLGTIIAIVLVQGIVLVVKQAHQPSPATRISMGLVYVCLPLGGALMAIHLLVNILKEKQTNRSET